MSKIAIVDIDDTICDLCPYLVEICNKMTGKNMTVQDWHSYSVYLLYGISQEDYFAMCESDRILSEPKPILLAQETLSTLIRKGYKVILLTARGWHSDAYNITQEWLLKHKFEYHELHILPLDKSKAEYIKENIADTVDIIIDDNAAHIESFVNNNISDVICLIDQPWNRSHTHLDKYRIDHIVQILRYKL